MSGINWNFIRSREGSNQDGNYTAKNNSGAYGAYQFMPSTWADVRQRSGMELPEDITQATNEQQDQAANWYGLDQSKAGKWESNPVNHAMAWNYGAGGANKILSADPNTPIESIIGTKAAEQNNVNGKKPLGMTVGQFQDEFNKEFEEFQRKNGQPNSAYSEPMSMTTLGPALQQQPDGGTDPKFWGMQTASMTDTPMGGKPAGGFDQGPLAQNPDGVGFDNLVGFGPALQQGENPPVNVPSKEEIDANLKDPEKGPQDKEEKDWLIGSMFGIDRPEWLTDKRQDQLLAIGTGLLQGNNWNEGFAAAGQNLLGMRQDQIDHQQSLESATQQGTSARTYQSPGNVRMKDGTVRADLSFNTQNGRYTDADGNDVTGQIDQRVNNSDAFGSKGQPSFNDTVKMQDDLTSQRNTLDTYDRVSAAMDDVKYGVAGIANDVSAYYNTMLSKGLTPEQIQRASAQGELQGLVGASREQVVGGGVMTEQDAVRVIMALGGDLNSIKSNPEVIKHQIGIFREKMLNDYNTSYEQYNATRSKYTNLPMAEVERYQPKYKPQSNSNSDVPEGVDPEDWKYMTDTQKELFKK